MHEMSVAESLVETIIKEAEKINAKPLKAVISCGQLNPINDEVMQFAFEVVTRDTVCAGMKLEVLHLPWRATCRKCKEKFDFDVYSPKCTKCGSAEMDMEDDAPLQLDEIEFDENNRIKQ